MIGLLSFLRSPWAALIGLALAVAGSATVSGVLVHRYDQARHDQVIADLQAAAATRLATETAAVLERERDAATRLANLETAYARLSTQRADAAAENARLSGDLAAAADRLRQFGAAGRGGDRVSAAAGGADRCAAVRAALDRALGAVDVLRRGGDAAAAIGQDAVDVATVAARAARAEGDQ